MTEHTHAPFYGRPIVRRLAQEYIDTVLAKYKHLPANDDLKQKIWDELQLLKHEGKIDIPFKVVLRRDPSNYYPPYIEVILDTKV